jgi:hypothetical protein
MSAITETEPGGQMVCIIAFSARPRGSDNRPVSGPRREFRLGERVRFVSSFFKGSPTDNPTGYMAVFEPLGKEGQGQYAATQNDFVSLDCWAGLEEYFRGSASGKNGRGAKAKSNRPGAPHSPRARP